ncbi:MAG: DUF4097 family beta strand repeat-containing protein [bacterium]
MRRYWFSTVLGAIFALTCLLMYRLEVPETRTRPARDVEILEISSHNGAVQAGSALDTAVSVKITRYAYGKDSGDARKRLEQVVLTDTLVAGTWTLSVDVPPATQPVGALFDITAPPTTRLNLTTSNGKVVVSGFNADVTVATTNSPVIFTGTTGDGVIGTTNGKVTVQVHSGAMTIQTTNGEIDCDIAYLPPAKAVQLVTSNNRITLRLPPDVSATITATTSSGTVVITGYQVEYLENSRSRIRARIGSGASEINLNTTNGDILIQSRY